MECSTLFVACPRADIPVGHRHDVPVGRTSSRAFPGASVALTPSQHQVIQCWQPLRLEAEPFRQGEAGAAGAGSRATHDYPSRPRPSKGDN